MYLNSNILQRSNWSISEHVVPQQRQTCNRTNSKHAFSNEVRPISINQRYHKQQQLHLP
jgi:hypothetical protein